MSDQPDSYNFVYVHIDIPADMTIREWRAHCIAERASECEAEREARRHGSRTCAAIGLIAEWASRTPALLRTCYGRSTSCGVPKRPKPGTSG